MGNSRTFTEYITALPILGVKKILKKVRERGGKKLKATADEHR